MLLDKINTQKMRTYFGFQALASQPFLEEYVGLHTIVMQKTACISILWLPLELLFKWVICIR